MKNLIILLLLLSSNVYAQSMQLIDWFAGADMIGTLNSQEELPSDFNVREFELSAYSQIDHTWQGSLTLAMHKHSDFSQETETEIHEAFILSNQLFSNTTFKLGRFFLGFGRLNRFHRHDWVISEAPAYHEEFFGFESVKDDGVEISKLLSNDFYAKLTAGITSGQVFKDDHESHGEENGHEHKSMTPHVPTHYLRLSTYNEFSTTKGLEYAINYIGRTDSEGDRFEYYGFDLIFKNKFSNFYENLFQLEFWQKNTFEPDGEKHSDMGAYAYFEKGIDQNHAIGLKLDWFRSHSEEEHEHEQDDHDHDHELEFNEDFTELSVVYTYTNSEFMRTRLTLSHSPSVLIDEEEVANTKFVLQTVFTIGAHPAHLY